MARSAPVSDSARSTKCTNRASRPVTALESARSRSRSLAIRNADSARGPGSCSMGLPAPHLFLLTWWCRVHGHRELRDVGPTAFQHRDLADAVLLHLVDAQDRMHRQEGALDAGELALDALLRGVEYHRGALAEQQFVDLDESEQLSVADAPGVDLVNLALIHEHNAENVTGCHGSGWGRC